MKLALQFSDFKAGGTCGRLPNLQYFITEQHDGRFLCHWSHETWETLEEAQAAAQRDFRATYLGETKHTSGDAA